MVNVFFWDCVQYICGRLLWLLIRPDLCSFRTQYRHLQRSSWSNVQTCPKTSRTVLFCIQKYIPNGLEPSWSFRLWDEMEYPVPSGTDSHWQGSSLVPKQWDRKHLVSLGWSLSKSTGYRGIQVLQGIENISDRRASLQGHSIKCIFSASLAWNCPTLLLHTVLEIRI